MRNQVQVCISALFCYIGLVKLVRWCLSRRERSLIILYYHSASGKNLRSQWLYLCRHYRILPLAAALEELRTPAKETLYMRDRRPMLALTFDDGYCDNYTHAFALASALRIPITIFLIPEYTGLATTFWWADRLISRAQVEQVMFEGYTYDLKQQEECKALAQIIDEHVSRAASKADYERLLTALCELLAVPASALLKEEPAPLLTWAQVQEMEESGWVSFGAHTLHHADLQRLTDSIEMQREVGECRTVLEQQLRHAVDIFAYPYGHIGDYGCCVVKQTGYRWAVTTLPGRNTQQSNPYLLHRIPASANRHVVLMATEVVGIWNFFTRLKRLAKRIIRLCHERIHWNVRYTNSFGS
jgi:peptidoglycan/xylan/chitin deacetylase (PgdA/CDA1 family)